MSGDDWVPAPAIIEVRAATDLYLVLGDGEKLLWAGRPQFLAPWTGP